MNRFVGLSICLLLWPTVAGAQQVVLPCTKIGVNCVPATEENGLAIKSVGGSGMAEDRVAVATTVTLVAQSRPGRGQIVLSNADETNPVNCGSNEVSNNSGLIVPPGESRSLSTQGAVYCIATGGTVPVAVLEVY